MRVEQSLKFVTDEFVTGELTKADKLALGYMLQTYGTGRSPSIITAIRYLRARYGISLKEGKDLAEILLANPQYLD